ncbi:MAG: plastocyanin/azurin family copper-binding protein [Verrucomicrobiales bacterium]
MLPAPLFLALSIGAAGAEFEIRAVEGLQFDPPRIEAKPGEAITIRFKNADPTDQPHNMVVVKPGARAEVVNAALALGADGPAMDFTPDSPAILAKAPVVAPGKAAELALTLPAEKGIYPYVCTFPGHGFVMYGAIYAGVPMPPLDKDENISPLAREAGKKPEATAEKRPQVQRIFMPDASPAAIAVALPGRQNACWDAGHCRLRYAWEGKFIDGTPYWKGNGNGLAKVLGDIYWSSGKLGDAGAGPDAPQFLGYRLRGGLPEFRYRRGGVLFVETLNELPDGIAQIIRAEGAVSPATIPVPGDDRAAITVSAGALKDGALSVSPADLAQGVRLEIRPAK